MFKGFKDLIDLGNRKIAQILQNHSKRPSLPPSSLLCPLSHEGFVKLIRFYETLVHGYGSKTPLWGIYAYSGLHRFPFVLVHPKAPFAASRVRNHFTRTSRE